MTSEAPPTDYRSLLEQEREALARQLAELGFGSVGGNGLTYDANFADSSQVTAERGEAEVLATELRTALSDVEHALEKLEQGTFGVCEKCHKPISPARLEAMPAVHRCIECAAASR